jgi:glycosyltransferase involved in cell wall biosynthesis
VSRTGDPLRVAYVAGTLGRGGAERQLLFQLRALAGAGAALEVLSLTRGEHHEDAIVRLGIPVRQVGGAGDPARRAIAIVRALRAFRPHVVQAAHFFVNPYVAAGARACGAVELGSLRSDGAFDVAAHGVWGRPLLHVARALVANAEAARRAVSALRIPVGRIHVLPNAVDLDHYGRIRTEAPAAGAPLAVAIGRLTAVKRYDRFLDALAAARRTAPDLRGEIVGDGPARPALEARARALGLLAGGAVRFAGPCDDAAAPLARASMLVSCSDHEGVPNVVLEAMAAGVAVIATPAGECPALVRDGVTGVLVPFEPVSALSAAMVRLAGDASLRRTLGESGRAFVFRAHAPDHQLPRLLTIYAAEARAQRRGRAAGALEAMDARHPAAAAGTAPVASFPSA